MVNIYLLRHGETIYNAEGNRYCGRTDAQLTEKGIAQAARVAELLQGVQLDVAYSSPLQRAYRTAQLASGNKIDVTVDNRLIEIDFGDWEGKTRQEFVAENPELWGKWCESPEHTPAGGTGETALQVVQRVDSFFSEIAEKHKNQSILVVAHNGINRLYLAWKLGMPLKNYRKIIQDNSTITRITIGGDEGFSLVKLNA